MPQSATHTDKPAARRRGPARAYKLLGLALMLLAFALALPATASANGATKGVLTTQPSGAVNGVALTGHAVVQLQDASSNNVDTSGVDVVATISSGTGTLSGTTTVATTGGVATFTNLVITGTVGSFTLTFTPQGLTAAVSTSFTLSVGVGAKGVLTTQPSGAVNGVALTGHAVVQIQDSGGNNSSAYVNVVATIASGTGTLSGTTTVATTDGVATFTDLMITGTVGSFTLTFTPQGLTAAVSTPFTLTAGAATQIAVHLGNGQSATAGTAVATAPSVIVKDANNNVVSGVSVTFAVATGGGSATGLTTTTNGSGIATVGSWTLGATAGSNTLTATSGTLTGSPVTFTATGAGAADAARSTLTPTSASITANGITTQVLTVTAKDVNGNNLSTGGITVTITRLSGTGAISSPVTDVGNGSYTATVTSPVATGSGVFVATLGGNPVKNGNADTTQATITYVVGTADAARSTLTPTSASITANGSSTQVLTVTAKDVNGNNLGAGGDTVTITRSSGAGAIGSVTNVGNGTYTATVTSPVATGSGVFVATLNTAEVRSGAGAQTQSTITYVAGTATKYLVTSSNYSPAAGANVTITAQLADVNGNAVATSGNVVTWTKSNANGSFAATTSTTDSSGIATVVFTTHTVFGTATTVTGTSPGPLTGASAAITTGGPTLAITAPTGAATYVQGSLLTVSWTTSSAAAAGEFGLWVRGPANDWYAATLVATSGLGAYTTTLTLTGVPPSGGYNAIVAWRPAAGSGAWASWGTSPGSFTVTTAAPTITVTAPTGSTSHAVGSLLTVSWTTSSAVSTGEFGLWVRGPANDWYAAKLVAPSGLAAYTTTLTLTGVPPGGGYEAILAWRPAAGSGVWSCWGTSPGSFTVTSAAPTITVTAPTGSTSHAVGSDLTVRWTTGSAVSTGEFGLWVRGAANDWYAAKLLPASGLGAYTTTLSLTGVPPGGGNNAIVAWRPTAGSGVWSCWGTSPGSFTVTAPTLAITAPAGATSHAVGSLLTVSWTTSGAASGGEFGLWVRGPADDWYAAKLLPASGLAAYTTTLSLTGVPPGGGNNAIVAWRPTAGSGVWSCWGTSPGSFTVTAR